MVSGLFFAIAVLRYGIARFRRELINTTHSDLEIGRWWEWAIRLVVVEAAILIIWWFYQVRTEPLFGTFGVGNILIQWGDEIEYFIDTNRWLVRRKDMEGGSETVDRAEAKMYVVTN